MMQWYKHEMDTTNIILDWIAHFRGQVKKTEARPGRGREQNVGLEAKRGDQYYVFDSLPLIRI